MWSQHYYSLSLHTQEDILLVPVTNCLYLLFNRHFLLLGCVVFASSISASIISWMHLQLVYVFKIFICRRFGTWPVAKLLGGTSRSILEGPVCNGNLVIGWHIYESSMRLRRFHAELSGFAFNSTILWDPERWQRRTSEPVRQLDSIKDGLQVSLCSSSFIIHFNF